MGFIVVVALLAFALLAVLRPGQAEPAPGGGADKPGKPTPRPYQGPPIETANAERCDFLDPAVCLQPWPNDHFTVPDGSTDTGKRMNLHLLSMPRNRVGKPIDNSEYNRNDGFSPGNMLITRVPGLDNPQAFRNTGAVPITAPGAYLDDDQPIVVINAETGQRHPIWSEIDFNPIDPSQGRSTDDPAERAKVNLIIRPAVNFEEGARYIVALRDLRDEHGDVIEPSAAFRVYRDRLITRQPEVESRRPHMEEIFTRLRRAGIKRSNLYLAWDFTVASERNLSERMLHIRDDAFAQLGDTSLADLQVQGSAPSFSIDSVQTFAPCGEDGCQSGEDSRIAREITGTYEVPCYLNTVGCAPVGSTLNYAGSGDGLPTQLGAGTPAANTAQVNFECLVPHAAVSGAEVVPARPSRYGHGLLGSAGEVEAGNVKAMANEHNFTFCATDWAGFAFENLPNILVILQDLSFFPLMADHSQQGFLNFLYLGRLMVHPDGFASDPAFRADDGDGPEPIIDTRRLFYDGNSQGGILGGALAAIAPDHERAVLGVPGMNYSTLLRRSVDFEPYAEGKFGEAAEEVLCEQADQLPAQFGDLRTQVEELCRLGVPDDTPLGLYDNYPTELERPLIISLIQMLWDRAEANGYAHHMTGDPLPNTPAHDVLLHVAFGDHQVANVAAEVEARTIGARIYEPALDPGRHWEADPFFGLSAVPGFPYQGSAIVYWDGGPLGFPGGTATPPNENIPPRPPEYGVDPHGYPRSDPKARVQKSEFLRLGGALINPCVEGVTPIPCYANGWTGPN